jgi:hypothetical protein
VQPSPEKARRALVPVALSELEVEDERSFRHVELYGELRQVLANRRHVFLVPERGHIPWDRALFLNLTFFDAGAPSDVLTERVIPADVVTHAAWHSLASARLEGMKAGHPSPDEVILAEAIASAFDLYLVGRLLGHAPDSAFLETQVPAMAEVALAAGRDEEWFEGMLAELPDGPEDAFEELRQLLFEVTMALFECATATAANDVLEAHGGHRFFPLLHHYELSTWIQGARTTGRAAGGLAPPTGGPEGPGWTVHRALRDAGASSTTTSLDWLAAHWVRAGEP